MKGTTQILVLLLLPAAGCGKSEDSKNAGSTTGGKPAPGTPAAKDPRHDYTLPYLTDERMAKFLKSMEQEKNPFEFLFNKSGPHPSFTQIKERMDEYNSFAQKYGFKDYEDYCAVWGRVTVAEISASAREMTEQTITQAQEELKKPNLSPEMRKMNEELVAAMTKAREDSKKQMNDPDIEIVKKYKPQIDEARKKYKKP